MQVCNSENIQSNRFTIKKNSSTKIPDRTVNLGSQEQHKLVHNLVKLMKDLMLYSCLYHEHVVTLYMYSPGNVQFTVCIYIFGYYN